MCAAAGVRADQLPAIRSGPIRRARSATDLGPALSGAVVGGGTIDAFGEQLVAGADEVGDVLLIIGATLIAWACVADWVEAPGLWTVPHTAPGKVLIGGPSNAGGILTDWAANGPDTARRAEDAGRSHRWDLDPADVPVVLPYVRGERTPLHDRDRRGSLPRAVRGPRTGGHVARRSEASGHSVRHHLDLAGVLPGPGRARWPAANASWPPGVACGTPPGSRPSRT